MVDRKTVRIESATFSFKRLPVLKSLAVLRIMMKPLASLSSVGLDADIKDATGMLQLIGGIVSSLRNREFNELFITLFSEVTVDAKGSPPFQITDEATLNDAFANFDRPIDAMIELAIEVVRYENFPFFREIADDIGNGILEMFSTDEEKATQKSTRKKSETSES